MNPLLALALIGAAGCAGYWLGWRRRLHGDDRLYAEVLRWREEEERRDFARWLVTRVPFRSTRALQRKAIPR